LIFEMSLSLASLTLETFTPHLGSAFVIHLADGTPLTLSLVDIKPLGQGAAGERAPFALHFQHPLLPRHAYLPQQIYSLEHATLGLIEIFLVPLGPQPGGMQYEAIFT
jgi:hypothetical protein